MYNLIIIGGGPAGVAAGIYAARKKIKTLLITESFGGQSIVSNDIQNWIGIKSISGFELAKNFEEHLRAYKDTEILEGDSVLGVVKSGKNFKVSAKSGKIFETKTVLVCSGSHQKRLGIPGEDEFDGKGVSWCSICDAPLFAKKTVAVIGAGNAGLEAARDLSSYAQKVYLIIRSGKVKGDPITFEEIKKDPRFEVIFLAEVKEILGKSFVTGIRYSDKVSNQEKELKLDGVFVKIGFAPNTEFLGNLADKNDYNEIIVDCLTQQASQEGIWAAGDVCNGLYRQNNIAVGDAIKAVLNIQDYLNRK